MNLKSRLFIIFGSIIYFFLLQYTYVYIITPQHEYYGFVNNSPSIFWIIVAFILAVLPSIWLPIKCDRPSKLVYLFLYIVNYVPLILVPYYTLNMDEKMIFAFSFTLFLSFSALGFHYKVKLLKIKSLHVNKTVFWIFIFLMSAFFYFLIIRFYGFNINIISLLDVYDVRGDFREISSQSSPIARYAILWQANVINVFFIIYGLITKRASLISLGVIGQLFIFSITGWKSVFFSILLIIAVLYLVKLLKNFGVRFITSVTSFMLISILVYYFFNSDFLVSVFIRRMILLPGLISGYFYEFFSINPKAYLGHSIFSSFINYPYSSTPPIVVGEHYWGQSIITANANANIWADGYANFGYIGMVLFSILLGFILWIYDSISSKINFKIAVLMLCIPAFSLSNSALLTTILTHGIGLTILLLYLMPNEIKISIEKYKYKF